ncbi:MAG: hypothetical protein MUP85_21660 [Candidatus Lokiarchaeota archaeon]|nr:hypothetical protein [Candidatus Lokiarchaeota archaeon]
MSWLKKEFGYIKDSMGQILKALLIVVLLSSGLAMAIFLRFLGTTGTMITFISIVVECAAIILCHFFLRGYIKPNDEKKTTQTTKKKL